MDFKSKFNFFDVVREITFSQDATWEICSFCNGSGTITGANGNERTCPVCYGKRGDHAFGPRHWILGQTLTIGEIHIKERAKSDRGSGYLFDNYGPQKYNYEERYMCYETGIGSGTLHPADTLFATDEEAQAECDKRNSEPKP